MLRVQVAPTDSTDGLFKAVRSHDVMRSQVWREIERLGCSLVPRGRDVVRLELGFRLCVGGLNGEARDKEELTLSLSTIQRRWTPPQRTRKCGSPPNADPSRWTQPVDDR